MKRNILSLLLAAVLLLSLSPLALAAADESAASPAAEAWYGAALAWTEETGLSTALREGRAVPGTPCSAREALILVWLAAGAPESGNALQEAEASEKAVAWVESEANVIVGDEDLDAPASRIGFAQLLYVVSGRSGSATEEQRTGLAEAAQVFSDITPELRERYFLAEEAVGWAVKNGVTDGTSDTAFSPARDCTVEEALSMLYRWFAEKPVFLGRPAPAQRGGLSGAAQTLYISL